MSDEVKRWKLKYGYDGPLFYDAVDHDDELPDNAVVVLATAYDALEAENAKLRKALLVAQNFIHDYSGRKADAATRVISAALAPAQSALCAICDQIKELHPNTHPWTARKA